MNIEKLKAKARERMTNKLTHRPDGKKPQLHPDSMWNVLLITELDEIVTSTYLQAVEDEKNNAAKIMDLILPLAKGYVSEHNVGSTRRYINLAEQYIDESTYFKSPDIKTI